MGVIYVTVTVTDADANESRVIENAPMKIEDGRIYMTREEWNVLWEHERRELTLDYTGDEYGQWGGFQGEGEDDGYVVISRH